MVKTTRSHCRCFGAFLAYPKRILLLLGITTCYRLWQVILLMIKRIMIIRILHQILFSFHADKDRRTDSRNPIPSNPNFSVLTLIFPYSNPTPKLPCVWKWTRRAGSPHTYSTSDYLIFYHIPHIFWIY